MELRIWFKVQFACDEADSKANYDIELDIVGCDIAGMVEIAKPMLVRQVLKMLLNWNKCVYRPENR